MLPLDAHPILVEVQELVTERRNTRQALFADGVLLYGSGAVDKLRLQLRETSAAELHKLADKWPDPMRHNFTTLGELQHRLDDLLNDDAHTQRIDNALTERARQLRLAVAARQEHLELQRQRSDLYRVTTLAAASNRSLTEAEDQRVRRKPADSEHSGEWQSLVTSADTRNTVLQALSLMQLKEARAQLTSGLLLTDQMNNIIAEALPALQRGEPMLLIGETGGAKTALAEYLSIELQGVEPEFVSGYGDISSAQVIGAHELRAEGGAPVSAFVAGPLLRAITEGVPLILDELNAMPPEFLKRLNRILQLRPGDSFAVQENAGKSVRLAPGFVIIATANEQTPHRYRGLERLSAELINRFGANTYRVHYPDSGGAFTDFPEENALLATAAIVDGRGELPRGVTAQQIERVARAAFISQQVFAGSHSAGFTDYVSTEHEIDGRPGLEESVLAPRTLVAILQKVAGSAGSISLDHALQRFVEGVMHREDRRVLTLIMQGQGFSVR